MKHRIIIEPEIGPGKMKLQLRVIRDDGFRPLSLSVRKCKEWEQGAFECCYKMAYYLTECKKRYNCELVNINHKADDFIYIDDDINETCLKLLRRFAFNPHFVRGIPCEL